MRQIFGGFSHLKYGYVKNICLSFLATMRRVIGFVMNLMKRILIDGKYTEHKN
jgi:hypothetical protein